MANVATETTRNESGAGQRALGSFRNRFGGWLPVAWKLALVYAVWILGSYGASEYTTNEAASQVFVVSFWFGWLFLGMTILGVLVLLTIGLVQDARR